MRPRGGAHRRPRPPLARPLDPPPRVHLPRRGARVGGGRARPGHPPQPGPPPHPGGADHGNGPRPRVLAPPAAARLGPEKLSADLLLQSDSDPVDRAAEPIELPCFDRTRSLVLHLPVPFTAPAAGAFARLESLDVTTFHDILDTQLSSFPRLRVLRIHACGPVEVVAVRSTTLEELALFAVDVERGVHVEAPLLKAARLTVCCLARKLSLSFSAPMVEKLHWGFRYGDEYVVGLHDLFYLDKLDYRLSRGIRTLLMHIDNDSSSYGPVEWSFAQEIARRQVTDFNVLRLVIESGVHALGPLLLHLLRIRPVIRRLELELNQGEPEDVEQCPQDCPCLQPADWKNENISLNNLEDVTISYGFEIRNVELDFLKLLFGCAPTLKRMELKVHGEGFTVHGEGLEEVRKICEENSSCIENVMAAIVTSCA